MKVLFLFIAMIFCSTTHAQSIFDRTAASSKPKVFGYLNLESKNAKKRYSVQFQTGPVFSYSKRSKEIDFTSYIRQVRPDSAIIIKYNTIMGDVNIKGNVAFINASFFQWKNMNINLEHCDSVSLFSHFGEVRMHSASQGDGGFFPQQSSGTIFLDYFHCNWLTINCGLKQFICNNSALKKADFTNAHIDRNFSIQNTRIDTAIFDEAILPDTLKLSRLDLRGMLSFTSSSMLRGQMVSSLGGDIGSP